MRAGLDAGLSTQALLSKGYRFLGRHSRGTGKGKVCYCYYYYFSSNKRHFYGRRGRGGEDWFCVLQLLSPLVGKPPSSLPSQGAKHHGNIPDAGRLTLSFSTSQLVTFEAA